ncbi:MAG: hypothetical protein H7A35_14715 [Planctomycetales bacterium]|nr:hypothetical protein [bacterium]UNM08083.1 MAG: hypothetical protein H7A35_14715 [Planctomycetales bacterium]
MLVRLLIVSFAVIACSLSIALAQQDEDACGSSISSEEAEAREVQQLADLNATVAGLGHRMRAGDYGDEELKAYLDSMLLLVYLAKARVNGGFDEEIGRTNEDLSLLVEPGLIDSWPLNPLNEWQPLVVSTDITQLGPGDIFFEICPPEYTSFEDLRIGLQSFNMYLMGGEGLELEFNDPVIYAENREWARVPYNSLYGISFYSSSRKSYWEIQERLASEGKPNLLHTRKH